ncbi:MAG: hypothetical protein AAF725_02650 [Acidobacteriota bacterium]
MTGALSLWAGASLATVERLSYDVEIRPGGSLYEKSTLIIRLDDAEDLESWQVHAIGLDENRRLIEARAWHTPPGESEKRLRRGERDESEASASGVLHDSSRMLIFEPEGLEVGSRLRFETEIETEPYFPAESLWLQPRGDAVENLRIEVRSSGGPPRAAVLGAQGLDLQPKASGFSLEGSLQEAGAQPELAAIRRPVLRFSWSQDPSWDGVGAWYQRLLDTVPTSGDALDSWASGLPTEGLSARQKLETAVESIRRQVRYVAVEVGIGGYRPTAPSEVAERRWGDCKDKSVLLIALLNRLGLRAAPALIRLDAASRIELDLPTPHDFNHLIVAVDASGFDLQPADPVREGWFFIDPTQPFGDAAFLHRGVHDQHALVVDGPGGKLVRLPTLAASESSRVEINLSLEEAGGARGTIRYQLEGESAALVVQRLNATDAAEATSLARTLLRLQLPRGVFSGVDWRGETERRMPHFTAEARVQLDGAVRGAGGGSIRLPAPDVLPRSAILDSLEDQTAALGAQKETRRYVMELPEGWCPPRSRDQRVQNAAGHVLHRVQTTARGAVEVLHEVELKRAWHPPETREDLKALAAAEERLGLRRLRFRCPNAQTSDRSPTSASGARHPGSGGEGATKGSPGGKQFSGN